MPKRKLLSEYEKGQIAAYKHIRWSNRKISNEIGRSAGCIDHFINEKNNTSTKKITGPKNKLHPRTKSLIIRQCSITETRIAKIKKELNLDVSRENLTVLKL